MAYVRQNIWELGADWSPAVLWYARAVKAMKNRKLAETVSWRFYGAIHGIDQPLWQQLGYFDPQEPMPSTNDVQRYWSQCQHGSWYFLPWHRGYLLAFEANVRAIVTSLGGPADWALPYWNYFKANQYQLPPAFASSSWPDGHDDNPLFVKQRYGPQNDGNVYVAVDQVNLSALRDTIFAGSAGGGSPGFGGVQTRFEHGGNVHGDLESQPHDWVHVLIGGSDPQTQLPGLMSDPDTAALDPIFWLHHANIDRLWQVWRQNPPSNVDPTDSTWTSGPASSGDRAFSMPLPNGSSLDYTPNDMTNFSQQNYTYDDFAPAVAAAPPGERLLRLGAGAATVAAEGVRAMTKSTAAELVGASPGGLKVVGSQAEASVHLDENVRNKVAMSLTNVAQGATPDRVYLNLENVTGLADATAFRVYVGLPEGADPARHPDRLAGSIALFGVRKASLTDEQHAGQGLTYVLDITNIVDALHLNNALNVQSLGVRIVPVNPVPQSAKISIGRISIFRQNP